MNAACKQWWKDHSDELTEWDWDSFRRVWEAAQLSVVAPSASHNIPMQAKAKIAAIADEIEHGMRAPVDPILIRNGVRRLRQLLHG